MSDLYAARGDEPIFDVDESDRVLILTMVEDPSAANYRSRQFEYNRLQKRISDHSLKYFWSLICRSAEFWIRSRLAS